MKDIFSLKNYIDFYVFLEWEIFLMCDKVKENRDSINKGHFSLYNEETYKNFYI